MTPYQIRSITIEINQSNCDDCVSTMTIDLGEALQIGLICDIKLIKRAVSGEPVDARLRPFVCVPEFSNVLCRCIAYVCCKADRTESCRDEYIFFVPLSHLLLFHQSLVALLSAVPPYLIYLIFTTFLAAHSALFLIVLFYITLFESTNILQSCLSESSHSVLASSNLLPTIMSRTKASTQLLLQQKQTVSRTIRKVSTQTFTHPPHYSSTQHSLSDPETTARSFTPTHNNSNHVSSKNMLPPLSIMSLASLLRSITINSISCSSLLLPPSLKLMEILAYSNSRFLNPDRNPILRAFLKYTFYAQFCAGENAVEVKRTVDGLKKMGFKGVMLNYAKEEVLDEGALAKLEKGLDSAAADETVRKEISPWKQGTLKTVELTAPGEFVAIK